MLNKFNLKILRFILESYQKNFVNIPLCFCIKIDKVLIQKEKLYNKNLKFHKVGRSTANKNYYLKC